MRPNTERNESVSADLLSLIVCPRDKQALHTEGSVLICPLGHSYRVVQGVPILLVAEAKQTHVEGSRSLQVAESGDLSGYSIPEATNGGIDPFVSNWIGTTNGSLYLDLVGNLSEYPIPDLRLPRGNGGLFLDIGSNWGRWCIAAARLGYRVMGVDPSLRSILAARRVSRHLGLPALYLEIGRAHV